ncbi:MAG: proteasome assembly chaperone family protein, partial [Candidatus Thermoplasmatota archaeon]|nr:proteasome assembly chaperone family protein [Candidatus Thermoplasmatota archaeon]
MDKVMIKFKERPKLKNAVLIEGLPGVGNVGKLAAEHLIEELEFTKFAEIFSKYLPPQVIIGNDGLVTLVKHDLYYRKKKDGAPDLVLLTGDYQGLTPEGQYELSYRTVELAEELGVEKIFTLGGYGVIKLFEEPSVLGAVTDKEMIKELEDLGVQFKKGEPSSGIIGASGLLLGLGHLKGMRGGCLMGETSGYFVDPRSARSVLKVLSSYLCFEIDYSSLEKKATQIDEITSKIKDNIEEPDQTERPDDLQYF